MLNGIKTIINKNQAFQESAGIILEETGIDIDDLIVLGEDTDDTDQLNLDNEITEDDPTDDSEDDEARNTINNDNLSNTDNNMLTFDDKPAEPTNEPNQISTDSEEDKDPMEDELDDLPTPIGKQTGEPINDDIDDIMHMEIDLKSNTISDALPIPPGNAGEAIASDEINPQQHVDSGFGGEEEENKETSIEESSNRSNDWKNIKNSLYDELDEFDVKVYTDKKSGGIIVKVFNKDDKELKNIKSIIKKISKKNNLKINETIDGSKLYININNSKPITEGISLAGGVEGSEENTATDGNVDTSGDPVPEDTSTADNSASEDPVPDASNEENPVTAAVRDKVNETESLDGNESSNSKEELLKKLSNITKNLEDAKKAIMDSI